jgi:hypothetical protein
VSNERRMRCLICGHDDMCPSCIWCHHFSNDYDPCCAGQCVTSEEDLSALSHEDLLDRVLHAAIVRESESWDPSCLSRPPKAED